MPYITLANKDIAELACMCQEQLARTGAANLGDMGDGTSTWDSIKSFFGSEIGKTAGAAAQAGREELVKEIHGSGTQTQGGRITFPPAPASFGFPPAPASFGGIPKQYVYIGGAALAALILFKMMSKRSAAT